MSCAAGREPLKAVGAWAVYGGDRAPAFPLVLIFAVISSWRGQTDRLAGKFWLAVAALA